MYGVQQGQRGCDKKGAFIRRRTTWLIFQEPFEHVLGCVSFKDLHAHSAAIMIPSWTETEKTRWGCRQDRELEGLKGISKNSVPFAIFLKVGVLKTELMMCAVLLLRTMNMLPLGTNPGDTGSLLDLCPARCPPPTADGSYTSTCYVCHLCPSLPGSFLSKLRL